MQFLLGSQENMQIASTSSQKHEINKQISEVPTV